MILPSKHIPEGQALIGVGALILGALNKPHTATSLWEVVRDKDAIGTYERYVLALDVLHILGLVTLYRGMIVRSDK